MEYSLRERIAARLIEYEDDLENDSKEWEAFKVQANEWGHKGDCPIAEHQGPITCLMCVLEDGYRQADAWIAEAQNKESNDFTRGEWFAFNVVLLWINTQTEQFFDRTHLYEAVMRMRPKKLSRLTPPESKGQET